MHLNQWSEFSELGNTNPTTYEPSLDVHATHICICFTFTSTVFAIIEKKLAKTTLLDKIYKQDLKENLSNV